MYDVLIIGGGASGGALLHVLTEYTTIKRIALFEKYSSAGQVNSRASNNSQTLHVGDIETNYSIEKVKSVYPAAMMVVKYADRLPEDVKKTFLFPAQKMVIAVGSEEVALLTDRYNALAKLLPGIRLLDRHAIARIEPHVIKDRDLNTPIAAISADGYAVDFEKLAQIFIARAKQEHPDIDVKFDHEVIRIERIENGYIVFTKDGGSYETRTLVVNADSYSLLLAKQLGYGKEFSLIPIAGSFYFSPPLLNGKVYTIQDPKLPFAAVHGDPDVRVPDKTRWGPTARFHPVLEARNFKTSIDYLRSSGLYRPQTWMSFAKILLDPTRLSYLLENMLYELPFIGTLMFLKHVRKIVPSIRWSDVSLAQGYGGMPLQRVDTKTGELLLGEGKIIGDHAIFNMTPSPGASVCLYNAMRDARTVAAFLGNEVTFDESRIMSELYAVPDIHVNTHAETPSLPHTYVS